MSATPKIPRQVPRVGNQADAVRMWRAVKRLEDQQTADLERTKALEAEVAALKARVDQLEA